MIGGVVRGYGKTLVPESIRLAVHPRPTGTAIGRPIDALGVYGTEDRGIIRGHYEISHLGIRWKTGVHRHPGQSSICGLVNATIIHAGIHCLIARKGG